MLFWMFLVKIIDEMAGKEPVPMDAKCWYFQAYLELEHLQTLLPVPVDTNVSKFV